MSGVLATLGDRFSSDVFVRKVGDAARKIGSPILGLGINTFDVDAGVESGGAFSLAETRRLPSQMPGADIADDVVDC